jgi:Family of unknown function (DUF6461)
MVTAVTDSPEGIPDLFDEAGVDMESLTVLLVAGGTRESVLSALGADLERMQDSVDLDMEEYSVYAVTDVEGGVLAIEHSGYADPHNDALVQLSRRGGAAAVARSNIQAHERFGCARDGELLFDEDEYMFIESEEKDRVPPELRSLFDSAWVDLDDDDAESESGLAGVVVGVAMASLFTGLRVTSEDLRRAVTSGYHRVRSLMYLG